MLDKQKLRACAVSRGKRNRLYSRFTVFASGEMAADPAVFTARGRVDGEFASTDEALTHPLHPPGRGTRGALRAADGNSPKAARYRRANSPKWLKPLSRAALVTEWPAA
jgi:hypothetical protein